TERRRHELAGWREDDRGVELLRHVLDGARPGRAQLEGERLRPLVAAPGQRNHAPAFPHRELAEDVRRGTKAVEADRSGLGRHPVGAIADQPGAEERRRLQIRVALRERKAETLVGDGDFRVAAVEVVARELGEVAEVLLFGPAEAALATCPAQPWHADSRAC